jgi:hypothetical protein
MKNEEVLRVERKGNPFLFASLRVTLRDAARLSPIPDENKTQKATKDTEMGGLSGRRPLLC